MSRTTIEMVREFHEVYGCAIKDQPDVADAAINRLRINLLREELEELEEALSNNDAVEALDALIDLQYVLDGAFLALGMHALKNEAFDEVHRSNMSKLGPDGKPILRESDQKVMKGPDYFRPDLAAIVRAHFEIEEAA
ncbi:MAG: hypothetical protein H6868_07675 [Rhodospirillales bacterium]|nr:hypothetical protein [Rhodospirillales bacterium]